MLTVAFPFTDPLPRELARRMIASVRETMPESSIVMLTDAVTLPVAGGIAVQRFHKGADFIDWRLTHMCALTPQLAGPVLWLDYDVIVKRSLAPVFAEHPDFTIALTRRDDTDSTISRALLKACPHNFGVAFSRAPDCADFWHDVRRTYRRIPNRDGWLDGQRAIEIVFNHWRERDPARVLSLPCSRYNYTPCSPDENLDARDAVHYKGERKRWIVGDVACEAEATNARNTLKVFNNLDADRAANA